MFMVLIRYFAGFTSSQGRQSVCGSQKLDGKVQTPINFDKELKKAIDNGLPAFNNDGTLHLTLFQVNAGMLIYKLGCISVNYYFI